MTEAQNRNMKNDKKNGFTLMEMLVVLVIIGLIAAVAIPQIGRLMGSAKSKAAKIQLETLGNSLRYYEIDNGQFPSNEQGLGALWQGEGDAIGWNGPCAGRGAIARSMGARICLSIAGRGCAL